MNTKLYISAFGRDLLVLSLKDRIRLLFGIRVDISALTLNPSSEQIRERIEC